ncbi:aldose epimerase [Aureimonas ureilytica]|uniref:Aldose epimerase n=1 Tax=Aureimonas ureilytica TaxID=401562 RepID=A0A175RKH7_9HYPH|nr:aldose 1-epimerase family protein [Aureimonas ureilytica]KTR03873.1 aldose epimerase [Aureimonas ureilytica]
MSEPHRIGTIGLSARIKEDGAELTSLRDREGREFLWQAGPEWPRHAPVLFPIVGRLPGDRLIVDGQSYPLTQHGFARDSRFEWLEKGETRARLVLRDSEESRARFPFAFELELAYEVSEDTLTVTTTVRNPGTVSLPYAVGAHPAFRWPLAEGIAKEAHELRFEGAAPVSACALEGGFLKGERSVPAVGEMLELSPELFAGDALVFGGIGEGAVRFEAPGAEAPSLRVSWQGFRDLGVWSKPQGAPFLCIEPWAGTTPPLGWDGEFADKPGNEHLSPGEARFYVWTVSVAG